MVILRKNENNLLEGIRDSYGLSCYLFCECLLLHRQVDQCPMSSALDRNVTSGPGTELFRNRCKGH